MVFVGVIVQSVPGVNDGMFIGGRFLVGFGSNLSQGSAPLLIMEASIVGFKLVLELMLTAVSSLRIPSIGARSLRCTTPCGTSAPS